VGRLDRGGREEDSRPLSANPSNFLGGFVRENDFGGAPTAQPILVRPDKMARYQKKRIAEPGKWGLIADRQSGSVVNPRTKTTIHLPRRL